MQNSKQRAGAPGEASISAFAEASPCGTDCECSPYRSIIIVVIADSEGASCQSTITTAFTVAASNSPEPTRACRRGTVRGSLHAAAGSIIHSVAHTPGTHAIVNPTSEQDDLIAWPCGTCAARRAFLSVASLQPVINTRVSATRPPTVGLPVNGLGGAGVCEGSVFVITLDSLRYRMAARTSEHRGLQ